MKWTLLHCLIWAVWFGAFMGYELWSGIDKSSRSPMLTQLTVRYVPWYITLTFCVWLFVHFAVRYFSPSYIATLKGLQ